ncbi:hypothetical protein MLD38_000046 [Melastoma candidum]|uniref:Uncharacterized protein n=1 Tax=Melastoma candidum TaxID=119954 RepID=A0ACB9SAT1_9MYRT|nr:hypothetical protein MLD38_000046 [Melastoma candidum]
MDEGGGAAREEAEGEGEGGGGAAMLSRKDKRKAMKKEKRRLWRRERAEKVKEEELAKLNDPELAIKIEDDEKEEALARERAMREFQEREKAWMERKLKEEEKERNALEEQRQMKKDNPHHSQRDVSNGVDEDDDWEYVEEGPADIIWKGNEIIVKKKKVRVPKKDRDRPNTMEVADLSTSNPLPPQSEASADYNSSLTVSAQQLLENVASQVPNFGTEQDKAHCPFHLKTGACRFGQRCSRVHFYPDKSCTLLIRSMYSGPGLAWEQDEGLEYTDEETERCYEEFYEDVHTEFLKFGELVNFKVCRNGSFHLRGNVYVHYKSLDSAVLAYHAIEGRYFAGKQVKCEFVNVTRWKVAICGEYMKSRYKTCSHGTACNFIHCFRNPGDDYEWADWDKPPPRYWMKKMVALFGYSEDYEEEKLFTPRKSHQMGNSGNISHLDSKSPRPRRSRSRERGGSRGRSYAKEDCFRSRWNNPTDRKLVDHDDYEDGRRGHGDRETAPDGDGQSVDPGKDGHTIRSRTRRNRKHTRHRDSDSDYSNMHKSDECLDNEEWHGHGHSSRSSKHYKKGRSEEHSQRSVRSTESTDVDDDEGGQLTRHGKKYKMYHESKTYHESVIQDRWDPRSYSPEILAEKLGNRESSASSGIVPDFSDDGTSR